MKILDTFTIRSTQNAKRKGATSSAGGISFEGLLTGAGPETAEATGGLSSAQGVGSVESMLALQSVSDEEMRRHTAVRQGHSMLDSLETLRNSLLMGRVPPEVIRELDTRLKTQRAEISDPILLDLLDDIELRVAVEKAKLEKALADAARDRGSVIG